MNPKCAFRLGRKDGLKVGDSRVSLELAAHLFTSEALGAITTHMFMVPRAACSQYDDAV